MSLSSQQTMPPVDDGPAEVGVLKGSEIRLQHARLGWDGPAACALPRAEVR